MVDRAKYIVSIVGAGQMGRGICQSFAMSGFTVQMMDVSEESLSAGVNFIKNQLDKGVTKGKWDENYAKEVLGRVNTTSELKDLSNSSLIIEAATENKDIRLVFLSPWTKLLQTSVYLRLIRVLFLSLNLRQMLAVLKTLLECIL